MKFQVACIMVSLELHDFTSMRRLIAFVEPAACRYCAFLCPGGHLSLFPINQWTSPRPPPTGTRSSSTSRQERREAPVEDRPNSADTTSYVLAQEVGEFVFSNHLFSPEREALGWWVFGRRNSPPLHGQIAAGRFIGHRRRTLKGQEVAFAGPEAFIGYSSPTPTCLERHRGEGGFRGKLERSHCPGCFAGKVWRQAATRC